MDASCFFHNLQMSLLYFEQLKALKYLEEQLISLCKIQCFKLLMILLKPNKFISEVILKCWNMLSLKFKDLHTHSYLFLSTLQECNTLT